MKFALIKKNTQNALYFKNRESAENYKLYHNLDDYVVVMYYPADKQSTEKQRNAIIFVEHVLGIKFIGNKYSCRQCWEFLSEYLEQAKQHYIEIQSEYETDRGY